MKLKNNIRSRLINKLYLDYKNPTLIMISCWKLHQLLSRPLHQQLVIELNQELKNEIKK